MVDASGRALLHNLSARVSRDLDELRSQDIIAAELKRAQQVAEDRAEQLSADEKARGEAPEITTHEEARGRAAQVSAETFPDQPDPLDFELPHTFVMAMPGSSLSATNVTQSHSNLETSTDAAPNSLSKRLFAIAEGTGALSDERSPTGFRDLDREMRWRLQAQDAAVLLMLFGVYITTLVFGWTLVYRIAQSEESRSVIRFFCKTYGGMPDRTLTCETRDMTGFLDAFNGPPKKLKLRIIGFSRTESRIAGVRWRGRRYRQVFNVALDLAPFVQGGDISTDDLKVVQNFLAGTNTLEQLVIHKEVSWNGWEDLATNIRQKLRTLGFEGVLDVKLDTSEELVVHQNQAWPNFVHHRTTRALVLLSVVGSLLFVPYVYFRCRRSQLKSRFHIGLSPSRYWQLIESGLNPTNGFVLD